MACNCESYTCVEAIYNPCSEGVQLDIVADESGDWSADIYFNGVPTQFSFGVTNGEKIIIPVQFLNEYYTHEFRLYDTAQELVGCYWLKALASNNAGSFDPIPPNIIDQILEDIAEINEELEEVLRSVEYTVTADDVADGSFTMPVVGQLQTISVDYQDISKPLFAQTGQTITLANMYEGQTLTLIYKPE